MILYLWPRLVISLFWYLLWTFTQRQQQGLDHWWAEPDPWSKGSYVLWVGRAHHYIWATQPLPPGPSLILLVGKLKPSVNQILFSFWPGFWTLDAAWLMGRRFSDRSLCSTSAGSDDQSLWKYPGLRSPFGAFVFPTLGTKPTLLFHGPLLLPASLPCLLPQFPKHCPY